MFRPVDIDRFNEDVQVWTKSTKEEAVSALDALGVQASSLSKSPMPLRRALRTAVSRKDGMPAKISFKIPRHAVFLHKGVGRGTTISQVGTTSRRPKPFLNPAIERNIDRLATIVADHQGTLIVNALTIR